MAKHIKRVVLATVTFIGAAAPTAIDATTHKIKRSFIAAGNFIGAAQLGAWKTVALALGIAFGAPTVTHTTVTLHPAWNDAVHRWNMSQWES